jgi:hypothetical protein
MESECPNCGKIVEPYDWFGKITGWDYLLNKPIYGNNINPIYYCDKCDQHFYTVDGVGFEGYPC